MDSKIAQLIVGVAEDAGWDDFKVYENYSGRGMYGEKTDAIVYNDQNNLMKAVAEVAAELARDENGIGEDNDERMTVDEFIHELNFRYDSMGQYSQIAY